MGRKRKTGTVHGWVNFDKPLGMTSTQAVGKLRWLFGAGKAGHAGTLDPLATGILPIALGEATKTVPYMVDAVKAYDFTLTFGEDTDTWDVEGAVMATSEMRPTLAEIEAVLPEFTGEISQIPPRYSAIKVDGQRAYDLARAGEVVELKARSVRIKALDILSFETDRLALSAQCGKGTYIRSLARDLAHRLGTCGHVTMLRRTQVGAFTQEGAFSLDALEKLHYEGRVLEALRPVETALDDIPVLAVTDQDVENLKQGREIAPPSHSLPDTERFLAMYEDKAIALCDLRDGQLRPKRVFNL